MSGLVLDTCFFFSQAFSSREKKEWSMYSSERNVDDERLYRRIAVWEHHTRYQRRRKWLSPRGCEKVLGKKNPAVPSSQAAAGTDQKT